MRVLFHRTLTTDVSIELLSPDELIWESSVWRKLQFIFAAWVFSLQLPNQRDLHVHEEALDGRLNLLDIVTSVQ